MTDDDPTRLRQLIGGAWREGGGRELARTNPARPGETLTTVRGADRADVGLAVESAGRAARDWSRRPAHERGGVLIAAASILEVRIDQLAWELSREEGKPLADARREVARAIQVLRYHGADADREAGDLYSSPRAGERILVTRRPLGVVAIITPFNFPIAIPAWKIAPALAAGNTVVWKPASSVPMLATRLAEAFAEAGLPDGVLNLIIGPGDVGATMAEMSGVRGLSFTGSTDVGRRLAVTLAGSGTAFQAEMGGKNASIVLADADIDVAADQVLSGAFGSTGQRCTATSRLIVEDAIADTFLDALTARTRELVVGNPLDPQTTLGPVVDDRSRDSLDSIVSQAKADGLREFVGPVSIPDDGHFVAPMIFELDAPYPAIWDAELFGPVLGVRRVPTASAAFAAANDTRYGLSGSVFTENLGLALAAIEEFEVGVLHINSESAGADPHVPFGGVKQSGAGPKEQGRAARDFFTETTTVYLRAGKIESIP